jgi:WD40 repeat protein
MITLKRHKMTLKSLAFSPDGKLLATCGNGDRVWVWELATKALVFEQFIHSYHHSHTVAFLSPSVVLVSGFAGTMTFDLADQGNRTVVPTNWTTALTLSPDATAVCYVGGWRNVIRAALPGHGGEGWTNRDSERQGPTVAVCWSGDGRTIAVGRRDGTVRLLDATTGEWHQSVGRAGEPIVTGVGLARDGRTVAYTASTNLHVVRLDGALDKHHRLGKTHFHAPTFHPSGGFFATANGDGAVDFWDARTGERRESFDWKVGKLLAVAFDPAGDRAACGGEGGQVVVWDVDR